MLEFDSILSVFCRDCHASKANRMLSDSLETIHFVRHSYVADSVLWGFYLVTYSTTYHGVYQRVHTLC